MAIIAPQIPISLRPHYVLLQRPYPVPPIADEDGGYVENWIDLVPPRVFVQIEPATAQHMEHFRANTLAASATHVITGPWHPGVTTFCQVVHGGRTFRILGVANRSERNVEMILACVELVAAVPTSPPATTADGSLLLTDDGHPVFAAPPEGT